jgi:hypothetical protein
MQLIITGNRRLVPSVFSSPLSLPPHHQLGELPRSPLSSPYDPTTSHPLPKTSSPNNSNTLNPPISPRRYHLQHHPLASCYRSSLLAAADPVDNTFAAAVLQAARTDPAVVRTGLDFAHTGFGCRSNLRWRKADPAGCRSKALAARSPGLVGGSRIVRDRRLDGWVAGRRAVRLGVCPGGCVSCCACVV